MSNSLFIQLEKYGSTRERSQTENFLTELVAYLLREEQLARMEFVSQVAGGWAKEFSEGQVKIETQVSTQSADLRLNGLRLDLLLTCGNLGLAVENKVDDTLTEPQLKNYLDYASEAKNLKVAVVSRSHQTTVEAYKHHPNWLKETLWREIAERWEQRKMEFSSPWLVQGVLDFMRRYGMGPFEPFTGEEIQAPYLWRRFAEKREHVLSRVSSEIVGAEWAEGSGLVWRGVFPSSTYSKKALYHQGVLSCGANCSNADDCSFWYFLGFQCSKYSWMPPGNEEPECAVMVGMWVDPESKQTTREFLAGVAERANDNLINGAEGSAFRVLESEDNTGIFLCRREPLISFMHSEDQISAIVDFFAKSHNAIKDKVCEIHKRHLELAVSRQEGDERRM